MTRFSIFLLCGFLFGHEGFSAPMYAKDFWLKKHAPDVAESLCEGNLLRCLGMKREECIPFFVPGIQACGERMYDKLPEYISGKEMAAKVSNSLSECVMNDMREQVTRKISANPKRIKKELCLEYVIPGAKSLSASPPVKLVK